MGWMELMLIGVVALIVVGPKDLPVMFQALGKMSAKVRRMAREFSSAMNEAANATGAADIAKDLKGMTSSKGLGMDALRDAADKFDKWEPGKERPVMGSETAKLRRSGPRLHAKSARQRPSAKKKSARPPSQRPPTISPT
jgi:sec-independent protein translocase protein TatB